MEIDSKKCAVKTTIFIALIYLIIPFKAQVQAQNIKETKIITFNMTARGYPPFMINKTESNAPGGIMYDVFSHILNKLGYLVRTTQIPKKREIEYLESGEMDAHAMAKEFIANHDDFEFTAPIFKVRNVVFSRVDAPVQYTKTEDLIGKRAITRLGFVYPPLTDLFNNKSIERINTISEKSMLRMVMYKRGDFTILNDLVGRWMIRVNGWEDKFVISKGEVTNYDYRIMFTKKWKPLVTKFNQELELMKKDGSLEAIISKYTKTISIK